MAADVTREDDVQGLVQAVAARRGMFDINTFAPWRLSVSLLPLMRQRGLLHVEGRPRAGGRCSASERRQTPHLEQAGLSAAPTAILLFGVEGLDGTGCAGRLLRHHGPSRQGIRGRLRAGGHGARHGDQPAGEAPCSDGRGCPRRRGYERAHPRPRLHDYPVVRPLRCPAGRESGRDPPDPPARDAALTEKERRVVSEEVAAAPPFPRRLFGTTNEIVTLLSTLLTFHCQRHDG